jgi:hypothetical protein
MIWYISQQNGNDSNGGQSYGDAFATLTKLNMVMLASGDTIYVGPGIYRELFYPNGSGSEGNPITIIADPEAQYLQDDNQGLVRITGADSNEESVRTYGIRLTSVNYWVVDGFLVDGANVWAVYGSLSKTHTIVNCTLVGGYGGTSNVHTIEKCYISGGSYGINAAVNVRGSVIQAGTYVIRDIAEEAYNTIALGGYIGFYWSSDAPSSNCIHCTTYGSRYGFYNLQASAKNNVALLAERGFNGGDASYSYAGSCRYGYYGVVKGSACYYGNCYVGTSGGTGAVSEKPIVSINQQMYALAALLYKPELSTGLQGWGADTSGEITNDILGVPHIVGENSDYGAGAYANVQESLDWAVYETSGPSIKIIDKGESVINIPCKAGEEVTVEVAVRYDNMMIANVPTISMEGKGINTQSDSHTGGANVWDTLLVSATPTIDEVLILRLQAKSGVASHCNHYFSDIKVSA